MMAIGVGVAALGFGADAGVGSTGGGAAGSLSLSGDASVEGDLDASTGDSLDASTEGEPPAVAPFSASYHIGADITWVQHDEFYGATYVDTDGVTKDILDILKNHGFNSIRLRTFVDPRAADGYDKFDGFGDLAHTVAMAERVKRAGMGLYLAIHYSDNWADPGKQCIPVAWQQDTFEELTEHVYDYTSELILALQAADATPELVQVGNEISPGMLIHVCDAGGLPLSVNPVNGRISSWANLAALLGAGIRAVKDVDGDIKTVLHIDRGGDVNTSVSFVTNALAQGLAFDVFADTCYVRWQGQPSAWRNTFNTLSARFPNLSFIIPEYGNETPTSPPTPSTMRSVNDTIFGIPAERGLGTWIYEPEHPAQAGVGIGLFQTDRDAQGGVVDHWPTFTALAEAMNVYDEMKVLYSDRL
jgi:arabinogalactan endo-1,4-beta-galactosidase